MIKYLKGTSIKVLILKTDKTKGIECHMHVDIAGGWKYYKGTDPGLVLSQTDHLI